MMIGELLSNARRFKRGRRVGRGVGSGRGKTCGRGYKGSGARAGRVTRPLTEGGQMPLFRRLPKRGFSNAQFRTEYQVVNVATLEERCEAGTKVTHQALEGMGLIHDADRPVKILGTGELSKKLDVEATAFSASATAKIAKAGGQAHPLVPPRVVKPRPVPNPEKIGKRKAEPAGEQAPAAQKDAVVKKEKGAKKEKAPKKDGQGGEKEPGGEKKKT